MGEHKHNAIAIAAKKGELPPKPKRMTKRERDALITALIMKETGADKIYDALRRSGNGGVY